MTGEGSPTFSWLAAALMLMFVLPLGAAPASAEDQAEGKRRFARGQELYAEGKYLEAAQEFEAGFAVAPRPLFLLNIGHSYRRAQAWAKARAAYERLLAMDPKTEHRATVEGHIRNIDDIAAAGPLPAPALETRVPPQPPPPRQPAAEAVVLSAPPPAPITPPSVETPPLYTRPWFWVAIGGVVAVGAGVGILALRRGQVCGADFCVTE
jgi:tetratricopeptide (TPR) repeat protein